jgi:acetamidase/formamidase
LIHELPLERRTLHGHFSRELEPVAVVDSGDSIAFSVPNAGWEVERGQRFEPFNEELDAGHALVGPVEVRGARTGQTLAVRIDEVRPGSWGVTIARDIRLDWELDGETGRDGGGRVVSLRPFLGVLGMPPPEPGRHPTGPPRRWGGNIDCKELVAGTTLFLPIPIDGALFSAGDGHALQGDGEVSGTAIECPIERAVVTLELRDDFDLAGPVARLPDAWLAFGFDEDLDVAADVATALMLDVMERELGLETTEALALASVAVDLRVTQVVNGAKGVHAVLRDGAIATTG